MSSSATLLYPPDGRLRYQPGDYKKIASETPIPAEELTLELQVNNGTGQLPPLLWLGWSIEESDAMSVLRKRMPDALRFICTSPKEPPTTESPADTLLAYNLPFTIADVLGIPSSLAPLIRFASVFNREGRVKYALSVGHNYGRFLDQDDAEAVGEMFGKADDPLYWHLDIECWKWQRRNGAIEDDLLPVTELREKCNDHISKLLEAMDQKENDEERDHREAEDSRIGPID